MHTEERYILAADVEFISPNSIAKKTKKKFSYRNTDVVITHKYLRARSKVLSEDAAALLKLFEKPQSWAEAILHHATGTGQDAQKLADDAFSLLVQLKEEGYLVTEAGKEQGQKKHAKRIGERIGQFTIHEVCQIFEDNAVYCVKDAAGKQYALKLFCNKANTLPSTYSNEIYFLQELDGVVNPLLIEKGEYEDNLYLVTEWCTGRSVEQCAKDWRNYTLQNKVVAMVDSCISILTAFDHLHSQGVLHGDIHPANIIIDHENRVRIIDYGFSRRQNDKSRISRGGVDFYYEPEIAEALLYRKALPFLTDKAEQYSLAVLLYHLITGYHYLDLSFEPPKAYRQILRDSPKPFHCFDLCFPPVLDKIFATALAKEPSKRFPSLKEFINALVECREDARWSPQFFVIGKKDPDIRFVHFLIQKYGWESHFVNDGLHLPPTCSVNFGAAGIAYFFYRAACINEDAELLALADVWANRATAFINNYDKAFHTENMDISEATVGRRSLYHSPTGAYLVQALISACRGDNYSLHKALNDYILAGNMACENIDLTLGKAGLLIGSSFLLNELNTLSDFNTQPLVFFTNSILKELWAQLDTYPAMNEKNPVDYFGIAHGWSGMLYATLVWCHATGQSLPVTFFLRLEELLEERIEGEEGVRWPVSIGNRGSWDGWCHGNAGYVFLWSLLHEHTGEERFLLLAEKTAQPLFHSQQEITQLCCGLAGHSYALLRLYRLTGKSLYWKKIEQLKHRIFNNLSSPELRNNSLYKGEVGIAVLLCELTRPELARMPLFE